MNRIIASLLALALLAVPARAQETKAQLNTDVSTNLPDNTTGAITPAILRTLINNMIASWQQATQINAQVGTSYAFVVGDYGKLVTFTNGSTISTTLPQAITTFATWNTYACNKGTGSVIITPTVSTIDGTSSVTLNKNQCQSIISDGTNYQLGRTSTIGLASCTKAISGTISIVNGFVTALTGC